MLRLPSTGAAAEPGWAGLLVGGGGVGFARTGRGMVDGVVVGRRRECCDVVSERDGAVDECRVSG